MAIVQGKDVLLKIQKGSLGLKTVACNANCAYMIDTDFLETTFVDSGSDTNFIPTRHTRRLTGDGPIFLADDITVEDITGYQDSKTLITWQFSLFDGTNSAFFNGHGYFRRIEISGPIGNVATCSYEIQVTGPITRTTTSGSSGTLKDFYYTATGGEVTFSDPLLIGGVAIEIERDGIGKQVVTSGTPTDDQAKFTAGSGTVDFAVTAPLGVGEVIHVIYTS